MAKKPSPSKRLAEVEKQIIARIEATAKRLPKYHGARAKLLKLCRVAKSGTRGPCDTEQAFFNSLVTSAAMKQIEADDARATADQKQTAADNELMLAMAAYIVWQACLNP